MEQLPSGVLLEIFYYLNVSDLCVCSAVCQSWKNLLDEEEERLGHGIWSTRLKSSTSPEFRASPYVSKLSDKQKLVVLENTWDKKAVSKNV